MGDSLWKTRQPLILENSNERPSSPSARHCLEFPVGRQELDATLSLPGPGKGMLAKVTVGLLKLPEG